MLLYSLFLFEAHSSSVDCPDLINLALQLGIQSKQPEIWNQLQIDCCAALGVVCDTTPLVTEVQWSNKGLDGFINGSAIPKELRSLKLDLNEITGSIPKELPNGLLTLILHGNKMTGGIPMNLPNVMVDLNLWGNLFSGDIPTLPDSIQYFQIGWPGSHGNHFTGTIKLKKPVYFLINDNYITDVVFEDTSGLVTNNCDLSENPLLGNPHITNLTMCRMVDLYSAIDLPITLSFTSTTVFAKTRAGIVTTERVATYSTDRTLGESKIQIGYTTNSDTVASVSTVLLVSKMVSTLHDKYHFIPTTHTLSVEELIKIISKLLLNTAILGVVLITTPFKREWKSMINKRRGNSKSDLLLF